MNSKLDFLHGEIDLQNHENDELKTLIEKKEVTITTSNNQLKENEEIKRNSEEKEKELLADIQRYENLYKKILEEKNELRYEIKGIIDEKNKLSEKSKDLDS